MFRIRGCRVGASLLTVVVGVVALGASTDLDPLAWLAPGIRVDTSTRSRLAQGRAVVQVLPSDDGELSVLAATPTTARPEALMEWFGAIAELKKSEYVLGVHRFSDPPVVEDLTGLQMDDGDLESLRRCQPGDCEVKLTQADILELRRVAAASGAVWKDSLQAAFRERLLARVQAYQAGGLGALPAYADRRNGVSPNEAFTRLLTRSPYLSSLLLSNHLERKDAFFYWSKERYGAGKAVVSLTHVDIFRSSLALGPSVLIVSTEVFASHYRTASMGVTALTTDGRGQAYLTYVNRSMLDVLGGVFGGLKRSMVERRVADESLKTFADIRGRIESGSPPGER